MNITILGTGAWGTALGIHFALHGHRIQMWSHNREHAQTMQTSRSNDRYLAGFTLPDNLSVHADMSEALRDSELVLVVTPVVGLRSSVEQLKEHGAGCLPILTACKGFTHIPSRQRNPARQRQNWRLVRSQLRTRIGKTTALRRVFGIGKQRVD